MKKLFKVLRKAVRDRAAEPAEIEPLADSVRIDGKTCLVTGSNSGLGKAVAIDLARRGGHVLMACRGGHPEAGEEVRAASGSDRVEMLRVDLSDMRSVHQLCDELSDRETTIDIAVLNAGVVPRRARRTPQGFELMFAVHFLANRVLVDRWLKDGTVRPAARLEDSPPRCPRLLRRPSLGGADRLRPLRRLRRLRRPGRDQALRREQARRLHLRDRTLAPAEPRRRGARRRALALPRPRQHRDRAGRAVVPEAPGRADDEALLSDAGEGRQARELLVLAPTTPASEAASTCTCCARSARPSTPRTRPTGPGCGKRVKRCLRRRRRQARANDLPARIRHFEGLPSPVGALLAQADGRAGRHVGQKG